MTAEIVNPATGEIGRLPLDAIIVGERSRSEIRGIESLAHSIREHSLIQPPVVRRVGSQWVLVAGERRLAAIRSLGWRDTPVVIAESLTDELAALYAEGDENTEREPFTVAEAVAHRRRIADKEREAAKARQGTRTDLGQELPHNLYGSQNVGRNNERDAAIREGARPSKAYERTTRHRTAKATGYGATTLDKAEEILRTAEDESQPAPVREAAQQSAEALRHHGVKVDREHQALQDAIDNHSEQGQARRDAKYRKELLGRLDAAIAVRQYDPEKVAAIADDELLQVIETTCAGLTEWRTAVVRARSGLRLVEGGRS